MLTEVAMESTAASASVAAAETPQFHLFTLLPPEIRNIIWSLALPPDIPEVYLRPQHPMPRLPTAITPSSDPPTVDTDYPVLMHVCRESRSLSRFLRPTRQQCPSYTTTTLHHSREIAHRPFRPDIDVMQINYVGVGPLLWMPDFWRGTGLSAKLVHVAVEASSMTSYVRSQLADAFRYLESVEVLHLIFRASSSLQVGWGVGEGQTAQMVKMAAAAPRRGRCKLAPLTEPQEELQRQHVAFMRKDLQEAVRARVRSWGEGVRVSVWDYEKKCLRLKIVPQMLMEFRGEGGWTPCA